MIASIATAHVPPSEMAKRTEADAGREAPTAVVALPLADARPISHITAGGIKEMSLQQEPDNVVWCVLENGKFAGMTYRREENVIAWHEHLIGGVFGSDAFGHVETVATVPGDLNEDDTYVVVKRTIGGATKRYIEYFSSFDI